MNQEDIKTPSNSLSPEKKQKEWKNILTIVFLVLFFPLGLILMWLLAVWTRTTKIIITVVFVGLSVPIVIFIGTIFFAIDDATERARDAQRLADVRQLSFILEREAAFGYVGALTGCIQRDASTTVCTGVSGGSSNAIKDYFHGDAGISDPAAAVGAPICNPNIDIGEGPCHYGISRANGTAGARTDDYQICFYLELDPDGDGHLVEGINSIRTDSRMMPGCN